MSDGFTIAAGSYTPTIFTCPKCGETIDSSAESCRFCGEKVDPEAAMQAALLLSRINQACSDASYMKSTALAVPVFFVLRFVPFLSVLGLIGFVGLNFTIPIWSVRWWFKYGRIESTDAEFRKARTTVKIAGIAVTATLLLFVVVPLLLTLVPLLFR
jgi:predicted RNA-binding Zn-ribbon protein involved in translation (DUF1610 family)